METEFREYLMKKKIDPEAFQKNEPEMFRSLESLFMQVHPKSFTMQKLFLINIIRRKYQLAVVDKKALISGKAKAKPIVKRAVQPKQEDTVEKRSSRPVMKKPAVKPKVSTEESARSVKPVVKKPVMKPKIKKKEEGEIKPSAKPIIKKPVVKPKITPKPKKEDEEKEVKPSPKPIMKKPVINPKIQPKKNKEE